TTHETSIQSPVLQEDVLATIVFCSRILSFILVKDFPDCVALRSGQLRPAFPSLSGRKKRILQRRWDVYESCTPSRRGPSTALLRLANELDYSGRTLRLPST
ncbi:hypothetical protein DOTSEDRAFT_72668, partial [Dothistroma septosporum NZE10]